MLEKLSSGLKEALRKITKSGHIDKATVDELVKDIQRTLLSSDVDVKLVFELTNSIKKRSLDEKPKPGITPREHVINVVYEELVKFIGEKPEILLKPGKIMFVGTYGAGKTTSIGKIARFYQKKGLRPAVIGCDVHRPASMDQLEQIAKQLNVPCYAPKDVKDASKIAVEGLRQFENKYDILIFDSSGRSSLDEELARELKSLGEVVKPDEVLLTMPADLGQAAKKQAEGFKQLVGITGIMLTKMDATARGGGAITGCAVTGAPIKFIGVGEKLDALEVFDPERFVSRLIGFGDLQGLLEKAKEAVTDKTKDSAQRMMEGKFTMNDFYEQLKSMGNMGSLESMIGSIPGMAGKVPKKVNLEQQEAKMKKWKYIIESLTKQERETPDIIDPSRVKRIAKGSGTQESEVRELIKSYSQSKKMMKMFSGKRGMMSRLGRKFKGFM